MKSLGRSVLVLARPSSRPRAISVLFYGAIETDLSELTVTESSGWI